MKYTIISLILAISLGGVLPAKASGLPAGSLIRGSQPAVYYITEDGKRLAFPNTNTYFTWYSGFNDVKFVSDKELASYPLAGNVTYRPGARLLKLASTTTVYVISHGGVLRPIMNTGVAEQSYGLKWGNLVDSLPDAFFTNYKVGAPVYAVGDYLVADELNNATSISADHKALDAINAGTMKISAVGPVSISGRMLSVAVDPNDENVAYAGSASGGIWKTTDMGKNWMSVTSRLASMHIGALAIDPKNPSTIYAGTGETYMPGDDYAYMGVYVSTDYGTTWKLLSATSSLPISAVASITIDPNNAAHIFIAGNYGIYETKDSGATWNKVLDGFVENVMIAAKDSKIVLATGSSTSVWRSIDSGKTWTKLSGFGTNTGLPDNNPWFHRLTLTQSTGKTLGNTMGDTMYLAMGDPFRIYRSDSLGASWQEIGRQSYTEKNYAVLADPTDADIVFTAGHVLRRATQGGWDAQPVSMQLDDVRALAYAPSNTRVMYAATNAGMEVSVDAGFTWQVRSNGLNTTQWNAISLGADGTTVYGSVNDLSVLRRNANGTWGAHTWNATKEIVADQTHAGIVYAVAADGKGVGRSSDNAESFSSINGNLPVDKNLGYLAVDPVSGGTLYIASGANVYGSNDSGDNWYLFGNNNSSSIVTSMAVSATTHHVFIGRQDGTIEELSAFNTNMIGTKWTVIYREPNHKPVAELSAVGGVVTVAFDANWGTRLGRLTNAKNWWTFADITGNLPDGAWPVALAVTPVNTNTIYVSHKAGAFRGDSADGKSWVYTRTEDGLPAVTVTDIAISPSNGKVYYATMGRGLFEVTK